MNMKLKQIKSTREEWVAYLLASIPPLIILFSILQYGVNSPYIGDDFYMLQYYQETMENGFNLIKAVTFFNNEHWMAVPLLIECAIWKLTNCSIYGVLLCSFLVLAASYFMIIRYIKKKELNIFIILPLSLLFFAPKFSFIYFWAICFSWTLSLLFTLISFYCYHLAMERNQIKLIWFSAFWGILASLSTATGLLVWISFFAVGILETICNRPKEKIFLLKAQCILCSFGIVCWFLYFKLWGGVRTNTPASLSKFIRNLFANLVNVAVNGDYRDVPSVLSIVAILGIGVFAFIIVFGLHICVKKKIRENLFAILVAGNFWGASLAQTYARSADANMLLPQYCFLPTMFLIGGYLLFSTEIKEFETNNRCHDKYLHLIVALVLVPISLANSDTILGDAQIHQANAYTVQNYERVPDTLISQYIRIDDYKETLDWAKENEFFLFGDDRVYEYPFEDFYMAEELEELYLPSRKSPQGPCAVDHVNGASTANGEIMLSPGKGFDLNGWALDEDASNIPSSVYLRLNGRYYKLRQSARADVAEGYENMQLAECGFMGYVRPSEDLLPGEYPIQLIVIAADASSYYDLEICTIKVE